MSPYIWSDPVCEDLYKHARIKELLHRHYENLLSDEKLSEEEHLNICHKMDDLINKDFSDEKLADMASKTFEEFCEYCPLKDVCKKPFPDCKKNILKYLKGETYG